MRESSFQPTTASEARLLLLINAFTTQTKSLEGRTKLAKLDFFLRYPSFLERALTVRAPQAKANVADTGDTIESRMIRYRYGPWDPAYFAILGSLIGRGMIEPVPLSTGFGYRATPLGAVVAARLSESEAWTPVTNNIRILRRHFDLTGTFLKNFIYKEFPEVSDAEWGRKL